jgi:type IV secretion system protein VirB11
MTGSPAAPLLRYVLAPIAGWLDDPSVEDIAIQKPREAWVYQRGAWGWHEVPLSLGDLEEIAILAGSLRRQDVDAANPLCSTELPDGQRLQIGALSPNPRNCSLSFKFN